MTIQEGRSHGQCSAPLFNPPLPPALFLCILLFVFHFSLTAGTGFGQGDADGEMPHRCIWAEANMLDTIATHLKG